MHNEKNNKENKKIGLIKGRHPLPVDEYILQGEVTDFSPEAVQAGVIEGISSLNLKIGQEIDLYITGLTIVSLFAVDHLRRMGITVNVYGYNPSTGEYYLQGVFPVEICQFCGKVRGDSWYCQNCGAS